MPRWIRHLYAFCIALVLAFGTVRPVDAKTPEIGELPANAPGVGGGPEQAKGPALIVPHDVPVVLPTAHETIPPVPRSYVTKNLGWLELSYPPSASERVASILRDADGVKAELAGYLGQPVLSKVIVRVAPTVADMARLAPPDAPPPEWASGVAYNGMHFVLLSMLAPHGADAVNLDEVFRHELAHVALEDAVQGKHVPLWFNEGLAIYLSNEQSIPRLQTLWNATLSGTLIPLSDLDRSLPRENAGVSIAYAESADFMRYLLRKSDRMRFSAMIDRVRDGQPFDRAISEAYGADLRRLEFEWRGDLEHRFSVIPVLTGGGLIWVLVIGALVAAYVRRRRRTKAILARWEREEAIEDARIAKMEAERAAFITPLVDVATVANAAKASAVSIKVEHHGRWHTLH
jgi:hypothetical protein